MNDAVYFVAVPLGIGLLIVTILWEKQRNRSKELEEQTTALKKTGLWVLFPNLPSGKYKIFGIYLGLNPGSALDSGIVTLKSFCLLLMHMDTAEIFACGIELARDYRGTIAPDLRRGDFISVEEVGGAKKFRVS
jgi:hypothetical protein